MASLLDFDLMWKPFIRPPRQTYHKSDLGITQLSAKKKKKNVILFSFLFVIRDRDFPIRPSPSKKDRLRD